DEHNGLVRLFRTARDRCNAGEIPGFKIRLYNLGGVRVYELPASDVLEAIVFEDAEILSRVEIEASKWQGSRKKGDNECLLQVPVAFATESICALV
ncbi:hypothetical protein Tco_0446018, partial [Tanacetum coccineum]